MKNALEMARTVQEYERKKQAAKDKYKQDIENARRGIVDMSWWERNIKLPRFKKQLQAECQPSSYGNEYYVLPFFTGKNNGRWSEHWLNYGAYLLEQNGYLNVKVKHDGIVGFYLYATLPKTPAEQILFSKKGS